MNYKNEKVLSIITKEMSDKDRAFYLKEKALKITNSIGSLDYDLGDILELLKVSNKTKAKKLLKEVGEMYSVFKEYKNIGDTNISAIFSRNNLYESISKSADMVGMLYVIININSVLKNSIKIE